MKAKLSVFSLFVMMLCETAFAGWQNDGYYIRDGYYNDDGSRFTIGFRGGISWAKADMKNEMGTLEADYWMNNTTGSVITHLALSNSSENPDNYTYAGAGNIATLPIRKDFSKMAFTAGASIGFIIPHHQQWRLEAGLDHIAETDYNETPFLEGNLSLTGGDLGLSGGCSAHVFSSGVTSTVTTDIISVMAFYDFFEGKQKTLDKLIPYIGFGVGYASSKTTLKLVDTYGDLSEDRDLQNYGTLDDDNVIVFADPADNEAPVSSNVALLGSFGASYGISEYTFLDFNFRLMYVPKITWQLVNGSAYRDWFAAKDMMYTNFMIGLRFEF